MSLWIDSQELVSVMIISRDFEMHHDCERCSCKERSLVLISYICACRYTCFSLSLPVIFSWELMPFSTILLDNG